MTPAPRASAVRGLDPLAEVAGPGRVATVNVGVLVANPAKDVPTAINKQPAEGVVWVRAPGVRKGQSGLEGDAIGDKKHHGGDDQAVYAYAREDLDFWEAELGRALPNGSFGENLTTLGADPNLARIGEQWQIGGQLLLQVTAPRTPCKTFAARTGEPGWARRFSEAGRPGAYFRVLEPGPVQAGDAIVVLHRPAHGVDIRTALFALTVRPHLLKDLLAAGDYLPDEMRREVDAGLKRGH